MKTLKIKLKDRLNMDSEDVYDATKYKEDGVYIINDGIATMLTTVQNGNVVLIPLPPNSFETEIEAELKDYINNIDEALDEILSTINKLSTNNWTPPEGLL